MSTFHQLRFALVITSIILSSCADMQPALDHLKAALPKPSAGSTSTGAGQAEQRPAPSIDTTPLAGIFKDKPVDSNPYPRVSIVVTKLPVQMMTRVEGVTPPTPQVVRGCWTMTATLWTDARHSTPVPEFSVCPSDQKFGLAHAFEWGDTPTLSKRSNTGSERTDGPLPPSQAMPHSAVLDPHRLNLDDGLVIVLYQLSYDYTSRDGAHDDRRLWFVSFPEAQLMR